MPKSPNANTATDPVDVPLERRSSPFLVQLTQAHSCRCDTNDPDLGFSKHAFTLATCNHANSCGTPLSDTQDASWARIGLRDLDTNRANHNCGLPDKIITELRKHTQQFFCGCMSGAQHGETWEHVKRAIHREVARPPTLCSSGYELQQACFAA